MSSEAPQQRTRSPYWSPAMWERFGERLRALWLSPAYLAKRDRMSEIASARWTDPAYRAEMCARMREGHARKRARLAEGATR